MEYVALPEELFKQLMVFLERQPFINVKDLIMIIQQTARNVQVVSDEPKKEGLKKEDSNIAKISEKIST